MPEAMAVFEAQDRNGNGELSRAEYNHFSEGLLLSMDFNEDGSISATEWINWDPTQAGLVFETAEIAFGYSAMAKLFVQLDADRSGSLSRPEFIAGAVEPFEVADRDASGTVDASEFTKAFLLTYKVQAEVDASSTPTSPPQ
jgi:Ca2+-binding EF-hand superfamily protein